MVLCRSALLSILSVLVLIPKGFSSSCIGNKCVCVEQISVIDCSRAGLNFMPRTKKRMVNYTALSLRDNQLLEVNFTWLMEQFPDLKTVDLRNNPIYCEDINAGVPLKVVTDCKTSKPTTHYRITAKTISSTTQSILVHDLTKYINSTTSDFTDSEPPSTVYLIILTASIISIPFIILCLRVVIKLAVTRRRRRRNEMGHSFEMIPFNLETSTDESDEQIIFDVTTL